MKLQLDGRKKIDAKVDYIEENENMPGTYTALLRLPEETGTPGLSGKMTCSKAGEGKKKAVPGTLPPVCT